LSNDGKSLVLFSKELIIHSLQRKEELFIKWIASCPLAVASMKSFQDSLVVFARWETMFAVAIVFLQLQNHPKNFVPWQKD